MLTLAPAPITGNAQTYANKRPRESISSFPQVRSVVGLRLASHSDPGSVHVRVRDKVGLQAFNKEVIFRSMLLWEC